MTELLHGTCYYPELWPEDDIARDIAAMQRLGINFVRMGDFAWSHLEPEPGRVSLDFFTGVMDQLHAAGIRVVFCTPTAAPPIWLTHGHPERCFVDADGNVMSHGARQHASYEHPAVRTACLDIADAIGRALGGHPALVAWQIDNELKCHVAEDFSPAAIAHWQRWLQQRFGTIARLNTAWGTDIWSTRYLAFDQVPAPRRTPFLHSASLSTAYRTFCRESIAEFLGAQCAVLRRHSDRPITHNFAPAFAVDLEQMAGHLDFVSFDDYPDHRHWRTIVLDNDLFRAAKPGRAHWFMETSAAHNGWLGNHETIHPPGFVTAEAVASYALGSQAFCYWLWRQQRTGAELPHSAILSAWSRPSIGYAAVESVELARRSLAPILQQSHPEPATAAITWSDRARAMIQTEAIGGNREHRVDYQATISSWHRLLLDLGLHRDIRFEGCALDGLKLLVTPLMPYASEAFLARIESFVHSGGWWLCGPGTGLRTAEHTLPTDGALGAIEQLAGVQTVFSFPAIGAGAHGTAFGHRAPLTGWCTAFRPSIPETTTLGIIEGQHAAGLAFATQRPLGKGAIVMLGCSPDGEAGNQLLATLVKHCAAGSGLAERFNSSGGTVVCPRRLHDGRRLWIVVNMDGAGGTVELPQPGLDLIDGHSIPAGPVRLDRYEWRAIAFA